MASSAEHSTWVAGTRFNPSVLKPIRTDRTCYLGMYVGMESSGSGG